MMRLYFLREVGSVRHQCYGTKFFSVGHEGCSCADASSITPGIPCERLLDGSVRDKSPRWRCSVVNTRMVHLMSRTQARIFQFAKLQVPVDFSTSSHEAREATADCAEMLHSELYLLHVVPMFIVVPQIVR
jgi:hypothetical protein